jgi:pyruvate dehydrogenase E2 component (dihydrolipoamide acetyltransferase)
MAIEILMPALSPTMTEGNLARWLKKEGDSVKSGEVIAEIETDKAIMEVEAADAGTLGKIVVPEKTEGVKVNQLIAVLLEKGEDKSAIDAILQKSSTKFEVKNDNHQAVEQPLKVNAVQPIIAHQPAVVNQTGSNRVFASPLAKRIAEIENVNLSQIHGSGPHGRIVKSDVLGAKGTQPKVATPHSLGRIGEEYTVKPLSQMRKVIAKRLLESKQNIPHFYLGVDCILDNLLAIREEMNAKAPKAGDAPAYKLSVNDFVIKASAHALKAVPEANASWSDNGLLQYNNIDISVAVPIDDGLITPIVKNADQKSLSAISNEMKDLIKRAKSNSLKADEFQGGGFSISNLGMYGIKEFNAIINPPQACIMAVGAAEKRPIVEDDEIEIATVMNITLSCDHRVVDGAVGARFLQAFKAYIENPAMMLA